MLRAYRRFFVVAYQFLPLLLAYARDRKRFVLFGGGRQVAPETSRARAQSLLNSLLTLGPTFIKLGQLLSTRPDVLPPEYIEEFEQLQDDVPPAPWPDAKAVIESDIGPIEETFDEFDTDPISGASLGQVYIAEVDGERVAVKVRRPNIEPLVEADLRVVGWSLPILMRFVGQARSFSLETIADEFEKTIREEMDYGREREMLTEIGENFAENDRIRVPEARPALSSDRVLTMEYVEGTKISDVENLDELGLDRTDLAVTLQETYLQMIVQDGVFHADPHPGNLAVKDDGRLVFYDFGMSGRVDPFIQDKIIEFYMAVAAQDTDAILDALVEMGTLSPEADREVMSNVMELAIADARGEDIEQYRVQQIIQQVEDTIYEFPLRLPPNLALVLRVATVVEGVCVTLDPDFDFISVATGYLREQGFIEESARDFVAERAGEARDFGESLVRVPPKLESTLDDLDRGDVTLTVEFSREEETFERLAKRIALAALLTATLISSSVLYAFSTPLAAAVAVVVSVPLAISLWRSFRRSSGFRSQPQFTRQRLRQRDK
ncbi:UbiB family protein [Natronomonas moolapensis 8.8.11]|uniref:UbiB family protein n=1 Tax=Natronomonas moolapensis (strain DSM 18674 / CECT 7526 / JCM 14361 / 8.8.11) TaxID=268739 RepID=M1XRQ2_NATM8|nr:AarF/ABC1/UbiB kinase family protein [Natronomonas moolapensis]CCQ36921.1 UbiB family protein [Natronomonas moolapensis 8.8.11]